MFLSEGWCSCFALRGRGKSICCSSQRHGCDSHTHSQHRRPLTTHTTLDCRTQVAQKEREDTRRMPAISTRKDRAGRPSAGIEKLKPCTHPPPMNYPEIDGQQTLAVCGRYKCISSPASNRRVRIFFCAPPRAFSHDPQSVACVPAAVTTTESLFAGLGSARFAPF